MPVTAKNPSSDAYFELVRAFPLRRIKNAAEHTRANQVYLRLSSRKLNRGAQDYLDVLVNLMTDYEKLANLAIDASHVTAAELVRHRLEQRGMSISALAREIDIPQSNLSDMLNGRRAWSKAAGQAISRLFNIKAERFLE